MFEAKKIYYLVDPSSLNPTRIETEPEKLVQHVFHAFIYSPAKKTNKINLQLYTALTAVTWAVLPACHV
jgi:hypothetical protein